MKELNLEVGQNVWSIQFGECKVVDKTDSSYFVTSAGITYSYRHNGNFGQTDAYPSLFESNPFDQKLVQETVQENKADLIRVLGDISLMHKNQLDENLIELSKEKLKKLLESL